MASCVTSSMIIPWMTVWSASGSGVFFAGTGWVRTAGVHLVRPNTELRVLGTNLVVTPALQTCNFPNSVDAYSVSTWAAVNSEGVALDSFVDLNSALAPKQLVRFGWEVKLSAGTTLAFAHICSPPELSWRNS